MMFHFVDVPVVLDVFRMKLATILYDDRQIPEP